MIAAGKGEGVARLLACGFSRRMRAPWNDPGPVREELFGVERLEQRRDPRAGATGDQAVALPVPAQKFEEQCGHPARCLSRKRIRGRGRARRRTGGGMA